MQRRPSTPATFLALTGLILLALPACAQPAPGTSPVVDELERTLTEGTYARLLLLFAAVTLAPLILAVITPFARLVISLYFLRSAFGSQQIPPNPVLIGFALFLTVVVMRPTLVRIQQEALAPFAAGELTLSESLHRAEVPLREYMFEHTRLKDLALLARLSGLKGVKVRGDIPTAILIPSYTLSELRMAFLLGFIIYLPFLVVDVVVASTLVSLGLIALPPPLVSLPFKLLLFVMVDGWYLLVGSLVRSFY